MEPETELYSIATGGQLEPALAREWLLTNGLGAFASSTVAGCNTRRYHGLLCAATLPPVGRMMTLNRVGEIVCLDGNLERAFELSINQFGNDFHPRGDRYLREFSAGQTARWQYQVEDVEITKELQLLWQRNAIALRYRIAPPPGRAVRLSLLPFVSLRDFHALRQAAGSQITVHADGRTLIANDPHCQLTITADQGTLSAGGDWWYGHTYSAEAERGQDCREDLLNAGRFIIETTGPTAVTLWASVGPLAPTDWDSELARRRSATGARVRTASKVVRRLHHAAADFIVNRAAPDGSAGTSVIAGYPWFADWGRDTMIALPGLLLATGRFEQARQVLSVFGQFVSQGMIPNRFDDYSNQPQYNTVDASLWYIHAAFEYLRQSRDIATFEKTLRPACRAIVDGYRKGTRFGIAMDEDGLITQGDANTQLTWMDAKCDGIAFTPRQGKAVEINALWYHALVLMGESDLADRVAQSFRRSFWISPFHGLYDVVDGARRDPAMRPNQIFAVSLPNSPLTAPQQQAVVEVVRRELLAPVGLRTLSRDNSGYQGRYTGPQRQRDQAYHNGTIWPWLIGPFLEAYLRVHHHSPSAIAQAREWLGPLLEQLDLACVGQINEIFEADTLRPVGCPAQAWSIAEVLRLAAELGM